MTGPREITFSDLEFKLQNNPKAGRNGTPYAMVAAYLRGHSVTAMLDEWVGPMNWKTHYETWVLDGVEVVRCYLSIWNPDQEQWVTKEDVGTYAAAHGDSGDENSRKGGISDATKRAASRQWGVGRSVYDLRPVNAPVAAWESGGKMRGKVDQGTLDYLRDLYGRLYPWLKGEPELDAIEDEDEKPNSVSWGSLHHVQEKAKKAAKLSIAAQAELEGLQAAMMGLTGAPARITKERLDEAGLWPIKDIAGDRIPEAWEIINRKAKD